MRSQSSCWLPDVGVTHSSSASPRSTERGANAASEYCHGLRSVPPKTCFLQHASGSGQSLAAARTGTAVFRAPCGRTDAHHCRGCRYAHRSMYCTGSQPATCCGYRRVPHVADFGLGARLITRWRWKLRVSGTPSTWRPNGGTWRAVVVGGNRYLGTGRHLYECNGPPFPGVGTGTLALLREGQVLHPVASALTAAGSNAIILSVWPASAARYPSAMPWPMIGPLHRSARGRGQTAERMATRYSLDAARTQACRCRSTCGRRLAGRTCCNHAAMAARGTQCSVIQ